jgi:hypothetical protein
LDRASAELRSLDFQYTNLPPAALAANAGGRVEFLKLSSGNWIVSRWNVRMPQLESRRMADAPFQRTIMSTRPVLRAVQITGGEVTRVLRRDSLVYTAPGPVLAVQIVAPDTSIHASGATLTLEGTDYRGTADSAGRIRLTPVLAGRYRASVRTGLMDSLGMPAISGEVEARMMPRVDSLRLPSPRDVLLAACPRDSVSRGEGMLHGTVRDVRAYSIPNAAVVATWQANLSIVGDVKTDHLRYTEKSLGTIADAGGGWRICGVPRETLVSVRVVSDSGGDLQRVKLTSDFATLPLVVRRDVASANREVSAAMGTANRPTALIEFSVVNEAGAPVPDASLEIRGANGDARTIVTGATGRALLPDAAPGTLTIRARRIGFKQGLIAATVEAGRNTVPIILSQTDAPTLDTVRVVGNQRLKGLGRLDGFEQRRVGSIGGHFITRQQIESQAPIYATDLLRRVLGVTLRDSAGVTIAISGRGMKVSDIGGMLVPVPCTMRVAVDGTLKEAGFDINSLSPNDIHGIEVYTPATVPPQFNGAKADSYCGLIMFWLR